MINRVRQMFQRSRTTGYSWLSRLHTIRSESFSLLRELRLDTYCTKRIEFERIPKIGEHWEWIKEDYIYLEEVMLHEYLSDNIKMTEKERVIAKDCVRLVGNFYRKASKESVNVLKVMNDVKVKSEKRHKVKTVRYRRD